MTRSYFLQLNNTDNLETVIKKCNTNFGSFSLTANRSTNDTSTDIDLTSLIDDIEAERLAREAADADLDVLKAPLASPALTGTPTAPTAAAGTNTTQVATTEFVMTAIASSGGSSGGGGGGGDAPIGTIIDFAGTTPPSNYIECDGREVLKTDYPLLYAAIGDSWGASPWTAPTDSLHFRVPNLNGRVTIGSSTSHAFASNGGEETHALTVDEMPSHTHRGMYSSGTGLNAGMAGVNTNNWYADGYNEATGGGQAHNNMQPFATVKKIIKATSTSSGGGSQTDIETLSNSEIDALWAAA